MLAAIIEKEECFQRIQQSSSLILEGNQRSQLKFNIKSKIIYVLSVFHNE
jgi:hypothetical protein